MALYAPARPITLAESFSFYVPSSDVSLIKACGVLADAVTVRGPKGPSVVEGLRAEEWDVPALFDRGGYNPKVSAIDAERWFDEQASAGADRLLTAGTWVEWDPTGDALLRAAEIEHARTSSRPDATAVFAVDHRWLTRSPLDLSSTLAGLDRPVALVLANPGDPLSKTNAVHGLIAVLRNVPNVSILRTDHGGLGAIVYGARHAALGLIGANRHFVPPGRSPRSKRGDQTARVFVLDLLDWFTALTISGWTTVALDLRCHLKCCNGAKLDRFFNERYEAEAVVHNRVALACLADFIIDAPEEERRRLFAERCEQALDRYGPMGKISMVTKAKQQLLQWAFV